MFCTIVNDMNIQIANVIVSEPIYIIITCTTITELTDSELNIFLSCKKMNSTRI